MKFEYRESGMLNTFLWLAIIAFVCAFFLAAGYIKGSNDATTGLSPTLTMATEVIYELNEKRMDCEKELWMNEKEEFYEKD